MRVFLVYPDERRDITDIYNGFIEKKDGVTVMYTHSIVNGMKVKDIHSTHHINARIEFQNDEILLDDLSLELQEAY